MRVAIETARARVEQVAQVRLEPHSDGDCTPGGGGTCRPSVLNSWPMKPSGVQLARPIRPPGRQTRSSSAADFAWSGANITPKVESTASKLASSKGSASASASWKLTCRRSAAARSAPRSSSAPT